LPIPGKVINSTQKKKKLQTVAKKHVELNLKFWIGKIEVYTVHSPKGLLGTPVQFLINAII